MDFGLSSIVSACTLCYRIYDRCSASRGEFKYLATQALGLHDILETIEGAWRHGSLTNGQLTSLRSRIVPLLELLEMINARLEKYGSLGTKSPKLSDKINWAIAGGAAEARDELNSQLQGLIAWNTSILLQRENRIDTGVQTLNPHEDVEFQNKLPESSTSPAVHDLQNSRQPTSAPEGGSIGMHSIGDGVQFLIFSVLSLLAFAIILIIGCFYIASLMLFPFGEMPTLFRHSKRDLQRFNDFYRNLFRKVFRFTSGLWD